MIHDVLPSPEAPVNPLEIAKFKESHGDELRRLRIWIDRKMFEGSQYEGDRLLQWTRIFRREAEVELDALVEAMKRRRWPKTVLVGIGGIVASGLNVAHALVTGIDAISAGLDVGSAALGLGPAGWTLAESLNAQSYEKQAPMAYAALATKTFRDDR